MANRRKFLAGIGALASGSAAAVGTGAFTSTGAERQVSVNVAGDQSAYLSITPGDSPHAFTEGGALKLDFSGDPVSGSGLNTDSFIKFNDLFTIQNQGDDTIALWVDTGYDSVPDVNNGASATFGQNAPESLPAYAFFWSFARSDQPTVYKNSNHGVGSGNRTSDTNGNDFEYGLDDNGILAPTNIAAQSGGIFDLPNQHPAVLKSGDSLTINFQINTNAGGGVEPTSVTDVSGSVVLNGFSKEFANDLQN